MFKRKPKPTPIKHEIAEVRPMKFKYPYCYTVQAKNFPDPIIIEADSYEYTVQSAEDGGSDTMLLTLWAGSPRYSASVAVILGVYGFTRCRTGGVVPVR